MPEEIDPTTEETSNIQEADPPEVITQEEAQAFLEQSNIFYSTHFIPDACNIPYVELRESAQKFQNWHDLTTSVIFDQTITLSQQEINDAATDIKELIKHADSGTTLFERALAPFIMRNLSYYVARENRMREDGNKLEFDTQLFEFISLYENMIMDFSNEDAVSSLLVTLMPEYANHAKFFMNAALLRLKGEELDFEQYRRLKNPAHARNFIRAYSLQEILKRRTPALGLKSTDINHSDSRQETEPHLPGIPSSLVVFQHGDLCDLIDEILLFGMPMEAEDTDTIVLVENMFPHFWYGTNLWNNSSTNRNTISRFKHVERTSSLLRPEFDARRVFESYLSGTPLDGRLITSENLHEVLTCDDLTLWLAIRFARELGGYVRRSGEQLANPASYTTRYRLPYRNNGLLGLAEYYADLWLDSAFTNYIAETTVDGIAATYEMPNLIELALSEYMTSANRSTGLGELADPEKIREHLKYSMLALGLEVNNEIVDGQLVRQVSGRRNDIEILKIAAKNISQITSINDIISMVRAFAEFRTEDEHIPRELREHLETERPNINRLISIDINSMTEEDKKALRNYFADIIQVRQLGIRRNTSTYKRNTEIKKPKGNNRI